MFKKKLERAKFDYVTTFSNINDAIEYAMHKKILFTIKIDLNNIYLISFKIDSFYLNKRSFLCQSCFNHRCYFRYGEATAKLLSENGYKVYAGCRDKNIKNAMEI